MEAPFGVFVTAHTKHHSFLAEQLQAICSMVRRNRPDGWIDWKKSDARTLVLRDLIEGVLPLSEADCSAAEAWEIYRHSFEFARVPFAQFEERLRDHRRQISDKHIQAASDAQALAHDRALFPRSLNNQKGELVFDLHPAKLLLRVDVLEGKHLTMKPSELQQSKPAYMVFDKTIFKFRIYQEVRRNKFLNYLAERRAQGKFD